MKTVPNQDYDSSKYVVGSPVNVIVDSNRMFGTLATIIESNSYFITLSLFNDQYIARTEYYYVLGPHHKKYRKWVIGEYLTPCDNLFRQNWYKAFKHKHIYTILDVEQVSFANDESREAYMEGIIS